MGRGLLAGYGILIEPGDAARMLERYSVADMLIVGSLHVEMPPVVGS